MVILPDDSAIAGRRDLIEAAGRLCYMRLMTPGVFERRVPCIGPEHAVARSTMAFAAIGDHARLPARFFARLQAGDGSLPSG